MDDPQISSQADPDLNKEIDFLKERLDRQELLIIESERRLVPSILNFIKAAYRNQPKGKLWAATKALLFSFFPSGNASGGSGVFALIMTLAALYFAYWANVIGTHSNEIGIQSNALANHQVKLEEATRRGSISSEVTAILDQINNYQISQPNSRDLPSTIIARIQTATQIMLPYEQPMIESGGKPPYYSPERSQLLLTLANLHLSNYRSILDDADFSYSFVSNFNLRNATTTGKAKFHHCQWKDAKLTQDTLINSHFDNSSIVGGKVSYSSFSGSDFFGAKLQNLSIEESLFQSCNFKLAVLVGIKVSDYNTFVGSNFEGAFVDDDFKSDVLDPLGIRSGSYIVIDPKVLKSLKN